MADSCERAARQYINRHPGPKRLRPHHIFLRHFETLRTPDMTGKHLGTRLSAGDQPWTATDKLVNFQRRRDVRERPLFVFCKAPRVSKLDIHMETAAGNGRTSEERRRGLSIGRTVPRGEVLPYDLRLLSTPILLGGGLYGLVETHWCRRTSRAETCLSQGLGGRVHHASGASTAPVAGTCAAGGTAELDQTGSLAEGPIP